MASRLKEYYLKSVVPALMDRFKYKNPMQVPGLKKIVVNMGLGEAIQNAEDPGKRSAGDGSHYQVSGR